MGNEQRASYYDRHMERVLLPYESSPWRELYDAAVSFLPSPGQCRILDIGCGTGRCAEAIRRAGHVDYLGLDFSPMRIEAAQNYVPQLQFKTMDVTSECAKSLFHQFDTFILTEFLEHIEADRDLIEWLPQNSRVIFSVPNYDSQGHVRWFNSILEVIERYGDLLKINKGQARTLANLRRPERAIFILCGRRFP